MPALGHEFDGNRNGVNEVGANLRLGEPSPWTWQSVPTATLHDQNKTGVRGRLKN